jgi:hypothetical protein
VDQDSGIQTLPERVIVDLLGFRWAFVIPTCSLTLLVQGKCFEQKHPNDRLIFVNASKSKGLHLVDKIVDDIGARRLFSSPESYETNYLSAPKDPKEFYSTLSSKYGASMTLRDALTWVKLQGFSDAIVHHLIYYWDEIKLRTDWKLLMLHRPIQKSAWKREIHSFHKKHGVRAHPAFLMLSEAHIPSNPLPVHDEGTIINYIGPLLKDTPALGVDFSSKEQDYHQWIEVMARNIKRWNNPP